MTATVTVLYPLTYGGFPLCEACFQRRDDLAHTPRDGRMAFLCGPCSRGTVTLPTGEALADTWERLARLHHNEEITDDLIDRALDALAPKLTGPYGWSAFEELQAALVFRQKVHDGDIGPAEVEPGLAHPGVLADAAQNSVTEAVGELVGGAR